MGNGTKLRHLFSDNPVELEGLIEALPFKVEVKSVQFVGGKWHCWFTLLDKDTLVRDVFPAKDDQPPPAKVSKKTRTRKKKT